MRQMAVFGLTSRNLAPTLRAKSNKSSRVEASWCGKVFRLSLFTWRPLGALGAGIRRPDSDSQCGCKAQANAKVGDRKPNMLRMPAANIIE